MNPNGLLTRRVEDYLSCLTIKHGELDNLLMQDEAHWAEKVELTNKEAEEIKQKIQGKP